MLGLGLLGRGVNDAKFFAECGAQVLATDLKTKEQLAPTLKKLSKYKNITYVLGEHRLEDFRDCDFVLKANDVPLNSPYIAEAKKHGIPVEMEGSLFVKLAEGITFVGITGTRGKTTTTYLIYDMLKTAFPGKVYLGGNIKGLATLPLIKKVKAGDIVVMELDSWQLQGWGDIQKSPHIAAFTNFLKDHLNYYLKVSKTEDEAMQRYFNDKAQIFSHQKENDFLIIDSDMKKEITKRYQGEIKSKIILPKKTQIDGWKIKIAGEHNKKHILEAIEVGKLFDIPMKSKRKSVENFVGVEGRLEFLREYKGIKIYNDTTATTPDATIVALKSLGVNAKGKIPKKKKAILIMGGADKNLDMSALIKEIPKYCKKVVLLAGTGTDKLDGKVPGKIVKSLKEAVFEALEGSQKGDILVLSPGFASFGMFKNEYDRGDKFVKIIKNLK